MFAVVIIREAAEFAPSFKYFAGVVGELVLIPGVQDKRSELGNIETCSAAGPCGRRTA